MPLHDLAIEMRDHANAIAGIACLSTLDDTDSEDLLNVASGLRRLAERLRDAHGTACECGIASGIAGSMPDSGFLSLTGTLG